MEKGGHMNTNGYVFRQGYGALRDRAHDLMSRDKNAEEIIYLPMVTAEMIWDFVDTVRDGLVIGRDPAMKPVSRQLRQLREGYLSAYRNLRANVEGLKEYADNFITHIDSGRSITRALSKVMDASGLEVPQDRRGLVLAAYVAGCLASGLLRYCAVKEHEFAVKAGLPDYGCILPDEFRKILPELDKITSPYPLPEGVRKEVADQFLDLLLQTAEEMHESEERMRYRTACVAYRNNGGCRGQARRGAFGCYPTSRCKRMVRYDKEQEQKQS